jgi:hypothetical protein
LISFPRVFFRSSKDIKPSPSLSKYLKATSKVESSIMKPMSSRDLANTFLSIDPERFFLFRTANAF